MAWLTFHNLSRRSWLSADVHRWALTHRRCGVGPSKPAGAHGVEASTPRWRGGGCATASSPQGQETAPAPGKTRKTWRGDGRGSGGGGEGVGCLTDGAKGCCDSGLAWLPLPVAVTLGFPPVAPSRRNSQFPTGRQATRQPGSSGPCRPEIETSELRTFQHGVAESAS